MVNNSIFEDSVVVSEEQFLNFKNLIEGTYFWDLNFETRSETYLDADWWTLEGLKEFSSIDSIYIYNIVERQHPRAGAFKDACEYLQLLAYPITIEKN